MKRLLPVLLLLALASPLLAQPMPTSGLDGIKVVVSFAHDVGDIPEALEYKGKRYELDQAADALLPQIGWKDVDRRTDIAMAWIEQVTQYGQTVLRSKPENAKMKFHQPKVVLFDDGSVEVKLWVRHSPGMLPQTHYSHEHYLFTNEGKLTGKTLEAINVPIL